MLGRPLVAVLLVALTVGIYAQVRDHEFVNYDDPIYITLNPNLRDGLSPASLARAFSEPYEKNWVPLTWISLQVDHALYGVEPAGYLLTNVALHALGAVLLFLALSQLTGAVGRSAFVAAVFAVHPLHVESVAWASERKDVLSGVFFMLTLLAWARYAERDRSAARYALVAGSLALGLLAKPMLVTLPFLLLLLDFWPLGRLRGAGPDAALLDPGRVRRAVIEKLPLFALAAGAGVVTLLVQGESGATSYGELLSFGARFANALDSAVAYVSLSAWPTGLTFFYPHPGDALPVSRALWAGAALLVVTGLALRTARSRPYLLVGWLWYLGTLVPVLGLVQVGSQARADRYTYLPQIGLAIALAWGAFDGVGGSRTRIRALAAAGTLAVIALAGAAWLQVQHWRDSMALFTRALEVTQGNYIAHHLIAFEHQRDGRLDEAEQHFAAAVALRPPWTDPYFGYADLLARKGRLDEATRHYAAGLHLNADDLHGQIGLGMTLVRAGRFAEARAPLERALALGARSPEAHAGLAMLASREGRSADAVASYRAALELAPDYGPALNNLAWLLATSPDASVRDGAEAVRLAEAAAAQASPPSPGLLDTWAAAYAAAGRFEEAARTADQAAEGAAAAGSADSSRAMRERAALYRSGRAYLETR